MNSDLRREVAALVATGALPDDPNITTVGSTSEGDAICSVCTQPVASGASQIELAPNPPAAYATSYVMHPGCHQTWLEVVSVERSMAGAAEDH
jgi:hypothetical protein